MADSRIRHARQRALAGVGEQGQQRLAAARVLVVGLGGLGCPAVQYLAGAGLGHLRLCDHDRVDHSNLSRQILFRERDVGRSKVEVAAASVADLDGRIEVETLAERLDQERLAVLLDDVDVVLDASDNFATRVAVNQACLNTATPWVMGAAVRFEGQLAVFRPDRERSPCYRCLYEDAAHTLDDCQGAGVYTPLTGLVGSAMAGEALRIVLDLHQAPARLSLFDARRFEWTQPTIQPNPDCPACT